MEGDGEAFVVGPAEGADLGGCGECCGQEGAAGGLGHDANTRCLEVALRGS